MFTSRLRRFDAARTLYVAKHSNSSLKPATLNRFCVVRSNAGGQIAVDVNPLQCECVNYLRTGQDWRAASGVLFGLKYRTRAVYRTQYS